MITPFRPRQVTAVLLACGIAVALPAQGRLSSAAAAPAVGRQTPAQAPACRVITIAGGPRGSESGGTYRLDEVRSAFSRQRDNQVVVYFRWEGQPGKHRLGARWRGPGGAYSTQSEFDYEARDREFGAYWTLPLSPSTPLGSWSIEALVNGLPCGSYSFDVTDAELPPAQPARRPLAPAQLYEVALKLYATVERSTPLGFAGNAAAGLSAGNGIVATSFPAVDSTSTLHVVLPDGSRQPAEALVGWNPRQGWALLKLSVTAAGAVPFQSAATPKVGERCYSMMGAAAGARVLVEGVVVGLDTASGSPEPLVTFSGGVALPGAPVFDEYGDVLGIVGGGPARATGSLAQRVADAGTGLGMAGGRVISLSRLPLATPAAPVPLSELTRRGVLMPPVAGEDVLSGGFSKGIITRPTVRPIDQRDTFSAPDGGAMFAFLTWDPKSRLKGVIALRVYDDANTVVVESKPKKTDLRPGSLVFSHWELPVPSRPGVYRVDVSLDGVPRWRDFFRVTQ